VRHLNYNHLLDFWTVARAGSIVQAAEELHITPQTISGQLKLLETAIDQPLFARIGRGLALTDTGRMVKQYADDIFSVGAELAQRVRSPRPGIPVAFNVGIVNSIPKLIAFRILEPVLALEESMRIVCFEADFEKLLGDLAVHRIDLVLADRPIPTGLSMKAYNHLLGVSEIAFFAHKRKASRYIKSFPRCLERAPVLLPAHTNALRRSLDDWFQRIGITPRIAAEFEDSALLKAFGEAGIGIFPAPDAIAAEVESSYQARRIGTVPEVTESYFAVSPERKLKHPAVLRITEAARTRLFSAA
jgi:LysR family transcriptional regulator, transcriptional activator of nhaA